ncbi:required for drug-induced death protein 1 [Erythrolamprus reginae]|uniref:required for drug-induced death protein 1 n=1 Tax=Erythrolamprus reginae TaxID=121349 RepID=UPI00396C826F
MPVAGALRAKFRRRRRSSPAEDKVSILEREERREEEAPTAPEGRPEEEEEELAGCASKTVAFAALPDNYQPLALDAEPPPARKTERASKACKRRLKKYSKNVGKVLQKGCSYLILGLQGLARAYTSPLGLAVWTGTSVR